MTNIEVPKSPNARFAVGIDEYSFTISIRTIKGMTLVSIEDKDGTIVNGCRAITGQWLIPYKHLALKGNFRFESEHSEEYPYYTGFNDDFNLVYYTPSEVTEIGW